MATKTSTTKHRTRRYAAMKSTIVNTLLQHQDLTYKQFNSSLIPNVDPDTVIGVRTPQLRLIAREMQGSPEAALLMQSLPHHYFEETNLHGLMICLEQDYCATVEMLDEFLPFVDNWATCDLLRPKSFRRIGNRQRLIADIQRWIRAKHPFTIRFGIEMLMTHFLDDAFDPEHLEWVAGVAHEHYYVRMMVAWYVATALAKQPTATLSLLEQKRLAPWTHNKAIQKAIESYRIPAETKHHLRTLRLPLTESK